MKKVWLILLVIIGLTVIVSPALAQLQNPLGVDDPRIVVGRIISAILGLVGSLALAVFIYGGFMWITSAGNDERVKKGKDALLWASLGLAVIFFSYMMVTLLVNTLANDSPAANEGETPRNSQTSPQ